MDWLLIGATVVSLGLAIVMSIVAWRLLHRDRDRSAARIEALEAMAFADSPIEPPRGRQTAATGQPEFVASTMTGTPLVDRLVPTSGARETEPSWDTMLGSTLPGSSEPPPAQSRAPMVRRDLAVSRRDDGTVQVRPLFDEPAAQRVAGRRSLAMAAMVLVLAGLIGVIALVRSPGILTVLSASAGARRTAVNGTPLELLSLRHAVEPAGSFSVTGLVQNPADGQDLAQIEAVLYLFDETGQFLTSARAPLEIPTLGPGDESAFIVRIPTTSTISRYRVGFRGSDGRAVAHVDRRGQLPEGTTGDVLSGESDTVTPARLDLPVNRLPPAASAR